MDALKLLKENLNSLNKLENVDIPMIRQKIDELEEYGERQYK